MFVIFILVLPKFFGLIGVCMEHCYKSPIHLSNVVSLKSQSWPNEHKGLRYTQITRKKNKLWIKILFEYVYNCNLCWCSSEQFNKIQALFCWRQNGVAWRENVVCFLVEENDAKTIFSSVLATWCLQMVVVCCLWVYTWVFFFGFAISVYLKCFWVEYMCKTCVFLISSKKTSEHMWMLITEYITLLMNVTETSCRRKSW